MKGKVGTIIPPEKPKNVPEIAQWLSGQGAGVWFTITATNHSHQFIIERYAVTGSLDCKRLFMVENSEEVFDINKPYQFVHVSHCAKCRIKQGDQTFVFNSLPEANK